MYLVRLLTDDGRRHISTTGTRALCGQRVGWELTKVEWKRRPVCAICLEKA